jgi:hypothetical protein
MLSLWLVLAAETALEQPWVWAAVVVPLAGFVAWLVKQVIAFGRETSVAMTQNTEVQRECISLLKEVADLVRDRN